MSTEARRELKTIEILLVEDDPADAQLTMQALGDTRIPLRVHVVSDGKKALTLLRRNPPYENSPMPDVVVTDLNLPIFSGCELLSEMKSDPNLSGIPVIVFSGTQDSSEIDEAYRRHAACFVHKPGDLESFFHAVNLLKELFVEVACTPHL